MATRSGSSAFQAENPAGRDRSMKPRKPDSHLDERLDEALAESFPASDPPAVHLSDEPPGRREPRATAGKTRRSSPRRTPRKKAR